jgi:hypothetical protein
MAEELEQKQPESEVKQDVTGETKEVSDLDKLKAELLGEIDKRTTESTKGLQRVIAKKDQQIKELTEKLSKTQSQSTEDYLKVLEEKARQEEDTKTLAYIEHIKRQKETELQLSKQEQIAQEKKDELETRIRESGEDPDDPKYASVFLAWEVAEAKDGKFERATKILDKLLPTSDTKAKKPTEKSIDVDAEVTRRVNEELKKRGLLVVEDGVPAGSPSTIPTNMAGFREWVKGLSDAEYVKHKEEIDRVIASGRLK